MPRSPLCLSAHSFSCSHPASHPPYLPLPYLTPLTPPLPPPCQSLCSARCVVLLEAESAACLCSPPSSTQRDKQVFRIRPTRTGKESATASLLCHSCAQIQSPDLTNSRQNDALNMLLSRERHTPWDKVTPLTQTISANFWPWWMLMPPGAGGC